MQFLFYISFFTKSVIYKFCRPNVLLGVTNPFFAKLFQNWPHIVRVGGPTVPSNASLFKTESKLKNTSKLSTLDPKNGLYTKYKPHLKKDKHFLKGFTKVNELFFTN